MPGLVLFWFAEPEIVSSAFNVVVPIPTFPPKTFNVLSPTYTLSLVLFPTIILVELIEVFVELIVVSCGVKVCDVVYIELLTFKLPVKSWLSSEVSPNFVEPLSNNIEALTNSVWNSCAVIVPVTVKSPVNVSVVFFNNSDANDCEVEVKEPDILFFKA